MGSEELPIFKRAVHRCWESLVDDMDFESMCDYLISKEVLTTRKIGDIKDEKLRSDRKRKLLEAIEAAGKDAYAVFREGLKVKGPKHLYDSLRREEKTLAKANTEQKTAIRGRQQFTSATSCDTAQPVTSLSRNEADGSSGIQNLSDDLQKALLNEGNNPQQAASTTTTLKVLGKVQQGEVQQSSSSPSANAESRYASQQIEIKSQTSDVRPLDVADGPTVVSPNKEDDTICRPQSTEVSAQGNSDEQPFSFGNYTSYKDMHESDKAEDLTSSLKQEYYDVSATNQQQHSSQYNAPMGQQNVTSVGEYANGANGGQRSRSSRHKSGTVADLLSESPLVATPEPAPSQTMPRTSPSHQHADSETRNDDDDYLTEHFDACVIYEQSDLNRAEEVRAFIESLNYKVCLYDDDRHFGMFLPDNSTHVIINHCVLQLIIISDNQDAHGDKYAKFIRTTIAMALKNSAKIRPVVFSKRRRKVYSNVAFKHKTHTLV